MADRIRNTSTPFVADGVKYCAVGAALRWPHLSIEILHLFFAGYLQSVKGCWQAEAGTRLHESRYPAKARDEKEVKAKMRREKLQTRNMSRAPPV
jgi:hypothetical protein